MKAEPEKSKPLRVYGQTSVAYGAPITKTRSEKLIWYNEELPVIPPINIETEVAYHPYLVICNENIITEKYIRSHEEWRWGNYLIRQTTCFMNKNLN